MVLAGYPGSKIEWERVASEAYDVMAIQSSQVKASESDNPRGEYKQLNVGISMGGGQSVSLECLSQATQNLTSPSASYDEGP